MMIGDQSDCFWRLRQALPGGWFATPERDTAGAPIITTVIDAVLWGMAWLLAFAYGLLAFVKLQARINTATAGSLDMIAGDFFGLMLPRNQNESDDSYRTRIKVQMFRQRATRPALRSMLLDLTGNEPTIVEPTHPGDCGGYGVPACGYGVAGAYGSMTCPWQAFVTVYRPKSIGVPNVPGYGASQGGYGVACMYAPAANLLSVTDKNIFAAVEAVRPIGTTVWVRLADAA